MMQSLPYKVPWLSPQRVIIDDLIVGIENSDMVHTNVRFHQKDTLKRFFERFEQTGLTINRFRADCGSYSEEIVEEIENTANPSISAQTAAVSLYNDIFALEAGRLRKSMALSSN